MVVPRAARSAAVQGRFGDAALAGHDGAAGAVVAPAGGQGEVGTIVRCPLDELDVSFDLFSFRDFSETIERAQEGARADRSLFPSSRASIVRSSPLSPAQYEVAYAYAKSEGDENVPFGYLSGYEAERFDTHERYGLHAQHRYRCHDE